MANRSIEVSVKGKWFRVPALNVNGKNIIVRGKWLKTALIHDEEWLETEVGDPTLCVRALNNEKADGLRADIFTFAQKIPATSPKYSYPVEWDSVAAIPITTFRN